MAVPWPAGVPVDHVEGGHVLEQFDNEPYQTEFEAGNIRTRVRGTAIVEIISETLVMTPSQYETFRNWWKTTAGRGTIAFDKEIRRATTSVVRTCEFVAGSLSSQFSGKRWMVSYKIRVLP